MSGGCRCHSPPLGELTSPIPSAGFEGPLQGAKKTEKGRKGRDGRDGEPPSPEINYGLVHHTRIHSDIIPSKVYNMRRDTFVFIVVQQLSGSEQLGTIF